MNAAESRPALFIADLHLSPELPVLTARFTRFIDQIAASAAALYILGDLFEAWIGDDDLDVPLHRVVIGALHRLAQADVPVWLLHGNRDFLLGRAFCRASGAEHLADPARIDLFGRPTLLMHGDSLCTDDRAYQALRAQVRDAAWQAAMLARPLAERRQIARRMRMESRRAQETKPYAVMDVNPDAVSEALRAYDCTCLIHGHTHRPGRHTLNVGGRTCERWVLPDWDSTHRGGYLACDAQGCRLVSLPP